MIEANNEIRRLFFALSVDAPWPTPLPRGRLLAAEARHMTLAFLGNIAWDKLKSLLPSLPLPNFRLGLVGKADDCLFLPPKHPHVVAYHVNWLGNDPEEPAAYQRELVDFLKSAGYQLDKRPFLPHITLARTPFEEHEWRRAFNPLPVVTSSVHLYESVGNLVYNPLWTHRIKPPFEEMAHTADVAYCIYGETMQQLGFHAQLALSFKWPPILKYWVTIPPTPSLDDIIITLNAIITRADSDVGCPLKAVSFHGEVQTDSNGILKWEMIIDV